MATDFGEDPTDFNNLEGDEWIAAQRKRAAEQAARPAPATPAAPSPVAATAAPASRGNVVAPVRPVTSPLGESMDSARSQSLMQPSQWSADREAAAVAGRARMDSDRAAYSAANPNARPIVTPARPPSAVVLTPEERARGASVSTPTGPAGTIGAQRRDGTYSQTVVGQGGQPDQTQRFASEAAANASLPRMAARPQAKSAAEAFLAARGDQGASGQPAATSSIVPPVPPQISGARPVAPSPVSPVGQPAAPTFQQMQREAVPVSPVARPADPQFARMQAEAVPVAPVVPRVVGGGAVRESARKLYEGSVLDVMSKGVNGGTARSPEAQLTTLRSQLKRTPEGPARQAIQRKIDELSGINVPANVVPPARPVARGPAA